MRMAGFSLGNLGQINAMQGFSGIYAVNAARDLKSAVNPAVSSAKKTKKKKGGKNQKGKAENKKKKKEARQPFEEEPGNAGSSPETEEMGMLQEIMQNNTRRKMTDCQTVFPGTVRLDPFKVSDTGELQKAVLWAEILGEPVSRKRRRKRMERFGSQENRRN